MSEEVIDDASALRAHYGAPSERAVKKQLPRLDAHCRAFIALSPFLVIATMGPDGLGDASPRGDAPGFVAVLDDATLLIPDRLGNNRIDSLSNLVHQPGIGLLFFVPGFVETLRINGRAHITTDATLLAPLAAQGKAPRSGLLVEVAEAYLQCGKALIRSKLWDPASLRDRKSFPSFGQILVDQIGAGDPVESQRQLDESYRTRLY
jgi:PPOX class probable FMN-dependent enzyme